MRINASKRNIEQYLNCNVGIKGLLKNKKGIHLYSVSYKEKATAIVSNWQLPLKDS